VHARALSRPPASRTIRPIFAYWPAAVEHACTRERRAAPPCQLAGRPVGRASFAPTRVHLRRFISPRRLSKPLILKALALSRRIIGDYVNHVTARPHAWITRCDRLFSAGEQIRDQVSSV